MERANKVASDFLRQVSGFRILNPTTQSHPVTLFPRLNVCFIPFFQPTDMQVLLLRCMSYHTNLTPEVSSDLLVHFQGSH
jgi:hypothetical protein